MILANSNWRDWNDKEKKRKFWIRCQLSAWGIFVLAFIVEHFFFFLISIEQWTFDNKIKLWNLLMSFVLNDR